RALLLADRHPAAADPPGRTRTWSGATPEHRPARESGRRAARGALGGVVARRAARGALAGVRALVQRVSRAAVKVEGRTVAAIGPGLMILLGVSRDDTANDADRLADKVRALRVFDDANGRMNEPLGSRETLCVSQFTLYGDARRGNRPSFVQAASGELA